MTLVREVADVIHLLADVIKNTREIVGAVNDGRKFLASRHPEALKDFSDLLDQIKHTIEGLAKVTSLISGFRFVTGGTASSSHTADRELARFNNYVIKQKKDITKLKNEIRKLKADCEKIRIIRDKLDASTKSRSWGSMFGLLGAKARQRTLELSSFLGLFYADDKSMIDLLRQTLELAEKGIIDIENALGPPGMANPYNVPAAAEILRVYAVLFESPQKELHDLADILGDTATALRT